MSPALTRIQVQLRDGRPRVTSTTGLLRPQVVHAPAGWCRIGLLATTALLLAGDAVELEVSVGPGAWLDLFDVAGTVAYYGRGAAARWSVSIDLAPRALLRWRGQPFVVADGANVTRNLDLRLDPSAGALVRDTVVLGRQGQRGGRLVNATRIRLGDRVALIEHQDLDPVLRVLPGLLGSARVLDTVSALGVMSRDRRPADQLTHFELSGDAGTLSRYLGQELALSPLHQRWWELTVGD